MTTSDSCHRSLVWRHVCPVGAIFRVCTRSFALGLVSLLILGAILPLHAGQPRYVYDDSGRLKAVIDITGNTAIYNYDAVGNLLSITQQASSLLS